MSEEKNPENLISIIFVFIRFHVEFERKCCKQTKNHNNFQLNGKMNIEVVIKKFWIIIEWSSWEKCIYGSGGAHPIRIA